MQPKQRDVKVLLKNRQEPEEFVIFSSRDTYVLVSKL